MFEIRVKCKLNQASLIYIKTLRNKIFNDLGFGPTIPQIVQHSLNEYRELNIDGPKIGAGGKAIHTTLNIEEAKINRLIGIAEKETGRDYLARGIEIVLRERYYSMNLQP